MDNYNQVTKNNFFYQRYQYRGQYTPKNFLFNANLQEFSQRISYICNLHTLGKLSSQESYEKIKFLWQQLEKSFQALEIDEEKATQ